MAVLNTLCLLWSSSWPIKFYELFKMTMTLILLKYSNFLSGNICLSRTFERRAIAICLSLWTSNCNIKTRCRESFIYPHVIEIAFKILYLEDLLPIGLLKCQRLMFFCKGCLIAVLNIMPIWSQMMPRNVLLTFQDWNLNNTSSDGFVWEILENNENVGIRIWQSWSINSMNNDGILTFW